MSLSLFPLAKLPRIHISGNSWILLLLVVVNRGWTHKPPPRDSDRCVGCPYFLETSTYVKTALGINVNLTCGVRHLGDRQVSWIRKRDLHVLTTDGFTYTTDERFQAYHKENSPYWILKVNEPRVSDSGVYECQISTQPKISVAFTLNVVVPHAKIKGTSEMFMKAGSDINITCVISDTTSRSHVTWYHMGAKAKSAKVEEINAGGRGGVQLVTDRRSGLSWLLVTSATWRDAGNYTCAPTHATPASVTVHVIDEGAPAAMQRDIIPSSGTSLTSSFGFFKISRVQTLLATRTRRHCEAYLLRGRWNCHGVPDEYRLSQRDFWKSLDQVRIEVHYIINVCLRQILCWITLAYVLVYGHKIYPT